MHLKAGQSLASAVDTTTVIVVRPAEGDVTLTCGGVEMSDGKTPSGDGSTLTEEHIGGVQLGKRYVHAASGLELLCTKAGTGRVLLDGTELEIKSANPLPSSD